MQVLLFENDKQNNNDASIVVENCKILKKFRVLNCFEIQKIFMIACFLRVLSERYGIVASFY